MSERTFDRETILDLTVNAIPLGILLFFVVVFLLIRPWEQDLFIEAVAMGLLVIPFVLLALLTFVSGRAISQDEKRGTAATTLDSSLDDAEGTLSDTGTNDDVTAAVEPIGTDDSDEHTGTDESEAGAETDATELAESDGSADSESSSDEH